MAPRYASLLDTRHWDDHKQDLASSAHTASKWCVEFIRPSLTTPLVSRHQIKRTAYLDGLRGFAALLVYMQHHQLWPQRSVPANRIFENAYGYDNKYYFGSLPIVRTFFTGGHFAVAVFFVISGYVLSAKPLALIYSGDFVKLGDNLASALFRRWIRLHLPVIVVSFIYMASWHAFGIWTLAPEHKSTFREELWNWYAEIKNFSFVFRSGGMPWLTYNYSAWSIPVEFRGSIIVYTALLAFSRATRNARLGCQVGLIFYFLYGVDGWFGSMFVAGMLLCELDVLARNDELPQLLSRMKAGKTIIFYGLFFVAAILSGVPSHSSDFNILKEGPGWYYLSFLKPPAAFDLKWFYLFWGAVCLVSSIPRIGWLKSFFETPFNQYLGRISFAFYLVHGPVLWTLGDRLYVAVGWYREANKVNTPGWINKFPLSKAGPLGLEPAFLIPQLILLPLTLWLAEIVTKLCDEPSVRFSQWAYAKILVAPKQGLELKG